MTYRKSVSGSTIPTQKDNYGIRHYNLSGQIIKKGSKGVNIIRMNDGSTKKIIVK